MNDRGLGVSQMLHTRRSAHYWCTMDQHARCNFFKFRITEAYRRRETHKLHTFQYYSCPIRYRGFKGLDCGDRGLDVSLKYRVRKQQNSRRRSCRRRRRVAHNVERHRPGLVKQLAPGEQAPAADGLRGNTEVLHSGGLANAELGRDLIAKIWIIVGK